MSIFNLKKLYVEHGTRYRSMWSSFKFEVVYSKNGVAQIYINDRKTKYRANGYGYDKESSVISEMINDITLPTKYKKEIYGHRGGFLSAGTGFSSIKESFESKRGNKLIKIYSGHTSNVYEITINQKYLVGA